MHKLIIIAKYENEMKKNVLNKLLHGIMNQFFS